MFTGPLEQRVEAARQREAWRQSLAYRKAWKAYWLWSTGGGVAAIFVYLAYTLTKQSGATISTAQAAIYIVVGVFFFSAGLLAGRLEVSRKREEFRDAQLLERYGDLIDQQSKLLDEDQLRLGELWRLSEERLRVYHEIATRQANTSFRNAQWAITAGFVVIIVGSCAVFFAKNVTIAIVVGTLGAAGAALSAYIGKTFLRLQENASSHLRSYFDQPREQFRYLAAERLLNHLTSNRQKAAAINEIIRAIAYGANDPGVTQGASRHARSEDH